MHARRGAGGEREGAGTSEKRAGLHVAFAGNRDFTSSFGTLGALTLHDFSAALTTFLSRLDTSPRLDAPGLLPVCTSWNATASQPRKPAITLTFSLACSTLMTRLPELKPASQASAVHGSLPCDTCRAMYHCPGGSLKISSGKATPDWLAGTLTMSCA